MTTLPAAAPSAPAACADPERLRILAVLDRARSTTAGTLPRAIAVAGTRLKGVHFLCGWGAADAQGRPIVGRVAQLLIVPTECPPADLDIRIYFDNEPGAATSSLQGFTLDVNDAVRLRWQVPPGEDRRHVVRATIPAGAMRLLPAVLLAFGGFECTESHPDAAAPYPGMRVRMILLQPTETGGRSADM